MITRALLLLSLMLFAALTGGCVIRDPGPPPPSYAPAPGYAPAPPPGRRCQSVCNYWGYQQHCRNACRAWNFGRCVAYGPVCSQQRVCRTWGTRCY